METPRCADHNRLVSISVLAAVLLPLFFSMAQASWPDDPTINLPVCVTAQMQSRPDAISDGAGGIIVAWQDYRNLGHDIYAQRIAADGTAMWGVNGVSVCGAAGEQEFPEIVPDGAGGAIIVWEDRRFPAEHIIYAQRVDADGVGQWTPDGIVVCDAPTYENQIQVIPDGLSGAIVSWTDGRDGLPDIYAQRLSAAGDTLWTFDGLEVCTDNNDQVESQLASDGSGGAIIAWRDGRGFRTDLYVQRIGAGGSAMWTQDGIALTDTNVSQDQQRMVPDGSGGAIVTWVDQRGGWLDIYGQRIAGGLRIWGPNGVPICTLAVDSDTPRPVTDGSGGVIVAWYDFRAGDTNIYAQRVSGGGFIQWAVNGVAVCIDGGEQLFPRIATDGFGGAVIAWQDYRLAGTGQDIFARRINGSGLTYWTADGVAITTALDNQSDPVLVLDGAGGAILAWRDERNDSGDILAQHVGSNGELGDLVPVAIAGFVARPVEGGVELTWEVLADETVEGYRIYRKSAGDESAVAVNAGLIRAAERLFLDRSASGGNDYRYTLAVILPDGTEYRSQSVSVTVPVGELMLEQNVPNPFNPQTRISFVLPHSGGAKLAIYDTGGRLVRVLADGPQPEGRREFQWDGRDERGNSVSSGVYFCRLDFGKTTLSRKMVLLR
jgi:hypothetical protein